MRFRSAVTALAGGVWLVAGIVGCAVVAAVALLALGVVPEGRADDGAPKPPPRPVELVVALSLGNPALQVGAIRGHEVVLARGLEIDLARLLQRRLHVPRIRFVDVRPSERLLTTRQPAWHLALASVRPSNRAAGADLSTTAYVAAGQAIVPRRGLPAPKTLDALSEKLLCARRGSDGAKAIAALSPLQPPLLVPGDERLVRLVQTGACDAALVDAVAVGRLVAGRGKLFGPITERVDGDDAGLVVAVARGGPFIVAEIDRALRRLRNDGSLGQLARRWLGIDPARLRPLR